MIVCVSILCFQEKGESSSRKRKVSFRDDDYEDDDDDDDDYSGMYLCNVSMYVMYLCIYDHSTNVCYGLRSLSSPLLHTNVHI